MLVRQAIVRFLEEMGVRYIFHLPGVHTLPLNESLAESNIKVIVGRHESASVFMADGFSRASGLPGVVLVTPGPGLANVVSGCMEAYGDDIPLVIIFIDVERKNVEKGILHGVREPEAIFRSICKAVFVIRDSGDLASRLGDAFLLATSARRGPVLLSIPYGILEKKALPLSAKCPERPKAPVLDPGPMEEALRDARRPVIIGGSGLMGKGLRPLLDGTCAQAGIPFLTSTSGKGLLAEDRPHVFGNIVAKGTARAILDEADLVIALGTRLRDVDSKRRGVRIKRLIHIDEDERWLGKNYPSGLHVAGDVSKAAEILLRLLRGMKSGWDMEGLHKARKKELGELERENIGFRIVSLLRRVIPDDAVTVWDLNMIGYWAEYYFPVLRERTFLFPRGVSPIFYAFPASLGAKLGKQEAPCLCVTGDGSFLPTAAELATVKKYGIPVVVLVYDNSSFGVLEDYMRKRHGIAEAMGLSNPDFSALVNSFGIKAARAESLQELERIFLNDVTWDEPYVVEFRFPLFPPPWG
ncbi:MAG: thiamine pyrophosphate-binding protein [Syntrophorhabdales bacterium]|jgi:acetolactate synthase-1/2/3 large subunit